MARTLIITNDFPPRIGGISPIPVQRPAAAPMMPTGRGMARRRRRDILLTLLGAAGESLGMISSPTPSRPVPIPCSARAACSTT